MTQKRLYKDEKQLLRKEEKVRNSLCSGVILKIYVGLLNSDTQYVIKISDNTGRKPFYCKSADLLNSEGKKFADLKASLMNKFPIGRSGISKIQREVENLLKENQFETIDEVKTRLYLGVHEDELEQAQLSKVVIEQYYSTVIDFIRENVEFFPLRNLDKKIAPDEGYIEKKSLGSWLADEKSAKEYGEEVIAISPSCLQEITTKNTTEFAALIEQFVKLGYFLDNKSSTGALKQVKLRYGVLAKRMYLVRISSEIEWGMNHDTK